jgi:potassium voltage-gated channel Eag-related subfamily H protein 8
MLGGVAFFSYIMENFMEIINNYNEKMGFTEHSEELNEWIVSLERFTNK